MIYYTHLYIILGHDQGNLEAELRSHLPGAWDSIVAALLQGQVGSSSLSGVLRCHDAEESGKRHTRYGRVGTMDDSVQEKRRE